MGRQLPPGNTTTTRSGNTTTTTTTSSGKFVGGKLVGPDGRAVNPADQADVDAANEMRKRMQQSGGSRGGTGISTARSPQPPSSFSGRTNSTPRPTTQGSRPPARPIGSTSSKPVARPTGTQPRKPQPTRRPSGSSGAGAEGEL
jgi:hypothetical protein